jgi:hypothetical protein
VVSQPSTLVWGWRRIYPGGLAGESSNKNGSQVICRESVQVDDAGGTEYTVRTNQAGEVTAAEVIKDRKSGESKGFAFITLSAQNEAFFF